MKATLELLGEAAAMSQYYWLLCNCVDNVHVYMYVCSTKYSLLVTVGLMTGRCDYCVWSNWTYIQCVYCTCKYMYLM